MGHGAVRGHAVQPGEVHVAGADQLRAKGIAQQRQQARVPVTRVAAAAAVVGNAALLEAGGIAQQRGLGLQPALALGEVGRGGVAEPDFVDDRQQWHFEEDGTAFDARSGMYLRARWNRPRKSAKSGFTKRRPRM
ncbi:hypothetical protein G6F31_019137 [Rhizopus arrhizus]|nr:hypothetical protein G6F31_019137 [Rhizopus arrhizus]